VKTHKHFVIRGRFRKLPTDNYNYSLALKKLLSLVKVPSPPCKWPPGATAPPRTPLPPFLPAPLAPPLSSGSVSTFFLSDCKSCLTFEDSERGAAAASAVDPAQKHLSF